MLRAQSTECRTNNMDLKLHHCSPVMDELASLYADPSETSSRPSDSVLKCPGSVHLVAVHGRRSPITGSYDNLGDHTITIHFTEQSKVALITYVCSSMNSQVSQRDQKSRESEFKVSPESEVLPAVSVSVCVGTSNKIDTSNLSKLVSEDKLSDADALQNSLGKVEEAGRHETARRSLQVLASIFHARCLAHDKELDSALFLHE
ncbi:hypothetical protein Tco_0391018 [Tanacetum coccineum]